MKTLGERLKEARERKRFKQIQVMRHTGINNKTLSGYENNVSEPDIETLKILSSFYEVDIDELLGNKIENEARYISKEMKNEYILKEIVNRYDIDLTVPDTRNKLEQIIRLVLDDHSKK